MIKKEISTSREASITSLLWVLSLIVIAITAWFSNGYFHADEHYQIIEFAGYQLGWNNENQLAWEFHEQIRPTLQPWIASGIIKSAQFFGIKDPYITAFCLRLIMGISMLFALRFFYRKAEKALITSIKYAGFYRILFFSLLLFSWFVPYLSVRFSSETAAAAAMLVAFGYLLEKDSWKNHAFLIGLWFGISFSFRFQIGFGIAGFGLWFLLFQRTHLHYIWHLLFGFLVILTATFLLDSLFYQSWTFTPWNYFAVNILQGESSTFGEEGLAYYFLQAWRLPTAFLGTLFVVSFIYNLVLNYKSHIVWFSVFFILGHLFVGHKEERFLFPLAFVMPYFIVFAISDIQRRFANSKITLFGAIGVLSVTAVTFFGAFQPISLEDAGLGRTRIMQYIHSNYSEKATFIRPWYANPYNPWEGLPQNFYLDRNLNDVRVDNVAQFNDTLTTFQGTILVCVSESNLLFEGYRDALYKHKFKLVRRSITQKKYDFDRYVRGINKNSVLYLFALEK